MNIETNRLDTFANWPMSAPVDPIRIAKAGFFYTGQGTEVQCFSCGGKISEWNYGDQVMVRHRSLEPNCVFVLNPQLSGNVPLILGRECPILNVTTERREQPDSTGGQDYGLTEEDEMYKSDALRLLSFINWDDPSVSRETLVLAGFYHAGEGRLRCAWCGGELAPFRNFGSLGHPLDVHRMYFPGCAHAASLEVAQRASNASEVSNVTSPSSPISYTPPIQSPRDSATTQPQSSGAAHNDRLLSGSSTWRALGVVGSGARHPMYAALSSRLATFERWPANRTQTPRALADAGFFYAGTDDQVRCFYCDGGLGKWEAGDAPWAEHARWFPTCGYVLLVKGQQYVDSCAPAPENHSTSTATATATPRPRRPAADTTTTASSERPNVGPRRSNSSINFPVNDTQVATCMESEAALAALGAGLDAARVRRAIVRRLRFTGMAFSSSEALIDAVLDEQLNEEAWSVSPRSQRLARDILADTLRDFAPTSGIIPTLLEDSSDSRHSDSPSHSPVRQIASQRNSQPLNLQSLTRNEESITRNQENVARTQETAPRIQETAPRNQEASRNQEDSISSELEVPDSSSQSRTESKEEAPVKKKLTLEEENRQLKEARLCKVCMDSEVSVVFLPCGHLVSCGGCGAALPACPLCRCEVKALVRAYLA